MLIKFFRGYVCFRFGYFVIELCFGILKVSIAANFGNQTREGMQYMNVKTGMPIEEHARNILTPYAFNILQREIVQSVQYATTEMANGSYLVRHYKNWMENVLSFGCQMMNKFTVPVRNLSIPGFCAGIPYASLW